MNKHLASNDEIRERAALHSLGLLDPSESAEFESYLKGCDVCAAEVRAFAETNHGLIGSSPGVHPSPQVRARLLKQILPPRVIIPRERGCLDTNPF
jgi:anti-sigma factor RsiW